MKSIFILFFVFVSISFSQTGEIYETYKIKIDSNDQSHDSIFPKPFQEFNYKTTQRGIEVYETYKIRTDSTNQSIGSIFSKPFPKYIITNDKIYETYKNNFNSTNQSNQTLFPKPFESKQILNKSNINNKQTVNVKVTYEVKYKEPLPSYNGEGDITYGE